MTLLVVSIRATSNEQLGRDVQTALAAGADAIELRIDGCDCDPGLIRGLFERHSQCRWIVTCRGIDEGGLSSADAGERASSLIETVLSPGTAREGRGDTDKQAVTDQDPVYIDFELTHWRKSDEIRRVLSGLGDAPPRMILSRHSFDEHRPDLPAIRSEVQRWIPTGVAKVAWKPADVCDNFVAFEALRSAGDGLIAVCMGEEGLASRVLAGKFGAFATYCSLSADQATAPGQVSLDDMRNLYRWDAIEPSTRVYGVIGDPVAQSLGPAMFNHWFERDGHNAVYLPWLVRGAGVLRDFLSGLKQRPWLDACGFSVTIPHKTTAFALADECPDALARRIGAVNTLVERDGRWLGYNTDAPAALASLASVMDTTPDALAGLTVNVLGAGGAARAVVAGLVDRGCRVEVYGRTADKASRLANDLGGRARAWDERDEASGDVLINATRVGMWPDVNASPVMADSLGKHRVVFDLVYNPMRTKLLRDAETAGCQTLGGWDMFCRQAAMQYELWFGGSKSKGRQPLTPCIALIGYRGSGKTTVAPFLAGLIGGAYADTDELIAKQAGRSIAEIFDAEGEVGFRRREREVIEQMAGVHLNVIAVGGGVVEDAASVEALGKIATIVHLTAPPEVLWRRIQSDAASPGSRPPLTGHAGLDEVREVLARRSPLYAAAADLTIDTSSGSPIAVAREIAKHLGE